MNSLLKKLIETNTVPNSLLFCGPKGSGKKAAAKEFAITLMGEEHTKKIEKGIHSDFRLFEPVGKSSIHSMETMRQLIDEAVLPPLEAPMRFFIILEAHRMLLSSSNALLKTLEEPPSSSYLLLLTTHPQHLLPTIISRCRRIDFFLPDEQTSLHPLLHDALSHRGSHHDLLAILSALEKEMKEKEIDPLFEQILTWCRDHEEELPPWRTLLSLLDTCRLAFARSMKLSVVLEYFFLKL